MQLKSCLRTLGFSATNDIFAENAWYFRNALVRANYTNLQKGIHETTEYLEAFLRNLLMKEVCVDCLHKFKITQKLDF